MEYLLWLIAACILPTWLTALALILTGHFLAASIIILVTVVFYFRGL